jgi:hypothetical protein
VFNWALFWSSLLQAGFIAVIAVAVITALIGVWWGLSVVLHRLGEGVWTVNPDEGPTAMAFIVILVLLGALTYAFVRASATPLTTPAGQSESAYGRD